MFKAGQVVEVDAVNILDCWYEDGEVYEVREYLPWQNAYLVKSVEGESYEFYTPCEDDDRRDIWIDANDLTPVEKDEVQDYIAELAELTIKANEAYKEMIEHQQATPEFKSGDEVVVVSSKLDSYWYAHSLGEKYTIKDVYEVEGDSIKYTVKEMKDHLLCEEDIELVEKEPEGIVMDIDPQQIYAAAKFLHTNNCYIDEDEDYFVQRIMESIKSYYPGRTSTSTCGYMVVFEESCGIVYVEVYVDPCVSNHGGSVEAVLVGDTLVVEI